MGLTFTDTDFILDILYKCNLLLTEQLLIESPKVDPAHREWFLPLALWHHIFGLLTRHACCLRADRGGPVKPTQSHKPRQAARGWPLDAACMKIFWLFLFFHWNYGFYHVSCLSSWPSWNLGKFSETEIYPPFQLYPFAAGNRRRLLSVSR